MIWEAFHWFKNPRRQTPQQHNLFRFVADYKDTIFYGTTSLEGCFF
jgi:hypothetical protein